MGRFRSWVLALTLLVVMTTVSRAAFTTFESGQVRPLALSPDGTRLFAVNTPDDQLEIFSVNAIDGALTHEANVPVGLEPVAVAARSNSEVWVVNHLSDSVSVVDLSANPPRVVRTLLVGDEPRDLVFAGTGGTRAFIATAHRGQNRAGDPQLTTPGIGRADVWVFDATNLGAGIGGTPLSVLTLFTDTPRALAASLDGNTVYAAGFHTGNRTTAIAEGAVCDGGAAAGACNVVGVTMPGGLPAPNTNFQGIPGPETGLIARFDTTTGQWRDQLGRNWNNAVRFNLPDRDVFAINANSLGSAPTSFVGVGTVLFNMVTNPVSGRVYVTNTEARNEVRFEGPGVFAGSTVRGHLHEARVTVLNGALVQPRHLNKHIDYGVVPSAPGVADASLATPTGMAITSDGATLYVAAFGSSKVGVFSTSALENDTFVPSAADHIAVTGGGPSGLVLNQGAGRLYVLTRFDNAVSVIDTTLNTEIAHLALHNPEPASVVAGRLVLYDARLSSSNGEASCASCHIFGDFDSLAWDLGNPDDVLLDNPNPFELGSPAPFHPNKGPMTTQSLRGMANHGPMHWRGDRTGGNDLGGSPLDENAAFSKFIGAFEGLLGRSAPITAPQMQAFTDFILQVTYPPNPIRALDDSLTPAEAAGQSLYFGRITDGARNCDGCHVLNPGLGFFGGNGNSSFENEPQDFKIAHLRNLYQKVGMFGMPAVPFFSAGNNGHQGDQVRGVGFLHDGSVDTLFRFHGATVFTLDDTEQANLEAFMLAFDSNLAPVVGQQVTLTSSNAATVGPRITLMIDRAAAGQCELTVKGILSGLARGWLRLPSGNFQSDRTSEPVLTDAQLRAHANTIGQERTYLCAPPGSGVRVGIDRDQDGFADRDEIDAGADPADPNDTPSGTTSTTATTTTTTTSTTNTTLFNSVTIIPAKKLLLKDRSAPPANPARRKVVFKSVSTGLQSFNRIVPPAHGSPADPRTTGATIIVFSATTLTSDLAIVALPASGWTASGANSYRYKSPTTAAPITSVLYGPDQLSFKGGKALWPYSLNEPSQGPMGVLFLQGGQLLCTSIDPKLSGNPPSSSANDRPDIWRGQPNTPPPFFCPSPL